MTTYNNTFTGALIAPALAAYNSITLTGNLLLTWPLETSPNTNLATPLIDISAASAAGAWALTLPPASSVGSGSFIIINNLSANPITVLNNGGAIVVASQAAGSIFFYYIQGNLTAAGVWFSFQYGAAISVPSVAAIAGSGLKAVGGTLAQDIPVITTSTTPLNVIAANLANFYNYTGGVGVLNLPLAAPTGNNFYIQARNSGSSILTITPAGSDLINGQTNISFNPGDSAVIVTDGTGWYTIGLGTVQPVFFNYQQVSVAGLVVSPFVLGVTAGSSLNKIAYKFIGILALNMVVQLPAYAQTYWINNATTGAFTLTFQVGAGIAVTVPQGQQTILYSDGVNVINAVTGSTLSNPVPVAQGGTGAVTAPAALTNLGFTAQGVTIVSATTPAAAQVILLTPATADAVVFAMVF